MGWYAATAVRDAQFPLPAEVSLAGGSLTTTQIQTRSITKQDVHLGVGTLSIGRMAPEELAAAAVVVTRAFAGTPEAHSLKDIRCPAVLRVGHHLLTPCRHGFSHGISTTTW